jgi:hypothetical protein
MAGELAANTRSDETIRTILPIVLLMLFSPHLAFGLSRASGVWMLRLFAISWKSGKGNAGPTAQMDRRSGKPD